MRLNRQQLQQFLPSPEAIKAFEDLFTAVRETLPTALDDTSMGADTAQFMAAQALGQLAEIAQGLSLLLMAPFQQDPPPPDYLPTPDPGTPKDCYTPPAIEQIAAQVYDLIAAQVLEAVYTPPDPTLGTLAPQNRDNVAITGGSVNGTPVGATTRAAGAFTTLKANAGMLVDGAAALGYATGAGAGGTVVQATSKTTAVTLNTPTGHVTMNNAALAAGASATFIVNNSLVANVDTVLINLIGGVSSSANYRVENENTNTGLFRIRVTNISAGSLSEALVIGFSVIKGAVN